MPLLQLGGEVEVQIGEDTYWLRETVSWRKRRRVDTSKGLSIHLPWGQIESGTVRIGKGDLVPVTPDAMEDVQMARLQTWLTRWSHTEKGRMVPITEANLERLPGDHVDRLLREISRLEEEQDGPAEDSPLVINSGTSSEPKSPNGAAS